MENHIDQARKKSRIFNRETQRKGRTMYFAILRWSREHYLLASFRYIAERDTFVNHSEFRKANANEVKELNKETCKLCRRYEKAVYDQDGIRVAYIHSLYRNAIA